MTLAESGNPDTTLDDRGPDRRTLDQREVRWDGERSCQIVEDGKSQWFLSVLFWTKSWYRLRGSGLQDRGFIQEFR